MLGGLLSFALATAPTPPPPKTTTPPPSPPASHGSTPTARREIWIIGDTQVAFTPVPIAFPLKAGILSATNHKEASHEGENLDNVIDYYSSDQSVFGTVYIYQPGLSHAGLAAIAQDWAIRDNSPNVVGGAIRVVAAGGKEGVALRATDAGYRDKLASSAAYIKAGRWLVTIRVSGPEPRKAEVEAAMDALLAGIVFGERTRARPAPALTVHDCPQQTDEKPAKMLPDRTDVSLAALGILGAFDGGGMEGTNDDTGEPALLPSRVPTYLCRAQLKTKRGRMTLLRAEDGEPVSIDGRTVRAALLSDSGRILEVDHDAKLGGYVLLYHDLGETDLLGTYDSIPSDKQLADILDGVDQDGGRIRVPVRFHADRGPDIILPSAAPPAPTNSSGQPSPPASSR